MSASRPRRPGRCRMPPRCADHGRWPRPPGPRPRPPSGLEAAPVHPGARPSASAAGRHHHATPAASSLRPGPRLLPGELRPGRPSARVHRRFALMCRDSPVSRTPLSGGRPEHRLGRYAERLRPLAITRLRAHGLAARYVSELISDALPLQTILPGQGDLTGTGRLASRRPGARLCVTPQPRQSSRPRPGPAQTPLPAPTRTTQSPIGPSDATVPVAKPR